MRACVSVRRPCVKRWSVCVHSSWMAALRCCGVVMMLENVCMHVFTHSLVVRRRRRRPFDRTFFRLAVPMLGSKIPTTAASEATNTLVVHANTFRVRFIPVCGASHHHQREDRRRCRRHPRKRLYLAACIICLPVMCFDDVMAVVVQRCDGGVFARCVWLWLSGSGHYNTARNAHKPTKTTTRIAHRIASQHHTCGMFTQHFSRAWRHAHVHCTNTYNLLVPGNFHDGSPNERGGGVLPTARVMLVKKKHQQQQLGPKWFELVGVEQHTVAADLSEHNAWTMNVSCGVERYLDTSTTTTTSMY